MRIPGQVPIRIRAEAQAANRRVEQDRAHRVRVAFLAEGETNT